MKLVYALLAVCVCLAFASTAESAVIYVKWDSPGPTFDGKSWATAFHKVQDALNAAVYGSEIWFATGTYTVETYPGIQLKNGIKLYGGFAGNEDSRQFRDRKKNPTIIASSVYATSCDYNTVIDGFKFEPLPFSSSILLSCGGSSLLVSNNTFNTCGVYIGTNGKPTIKGNLFIGYNSDNGSALYCDTRAGAAIISDNVFQGNSSKQAIVYCNGAVSMVANNTFAGNRGISLLVQCNATVANNTIINNTEGIKCAFFSPSIINNTIAWNNGPGISCHAATPKISNNIVAFNSSGVVNIASSTPTLKSNCVYGNTTGNYSNLTDPTGTEGNISEDPLLASLDYSNAHIRYSSPCRDTGDSSAVQAGWVDMDGQARIQGGCTDIGADESNGIDWSSGPYTIVRVSPNGDDVNDGSSWQTAKKTVQAAIDTAAVVGGDVWVQAGTYKERITLRPNVYLYGGFDADDTTRDERDWMSNTTVLDGQRGGTVVVTDAGSAKGAIDGFTVRNGVKDAKLNCAGIYCYMSSPSISHNIITGNDAGQSYSVAGISCDKSSSRITNNVIMGNRGTALDCYNSSLHIINNTIVNNYSYENAPALICYDTPGSSFVIINNLVAFNDKGVAASLNGGSSSIIFKNNCVYSNKDYDYSNSQNPTGTNGNISTDPKLVSLAYGNAHIQADSPCRNAGDNSAIQSGWMDIDHDPSNLDGRVDIGADKADDTIWTVTPKVVMVSNDGDDANDGSSWQMAKRTIQNAVDTAAENNGGDVWVKAGMYNEYIELRPFVHLFGGFEGTESSISQRDCAAHSTVIDAQKMPHKTGVTLNYGCCRIDGFTVYNSATYGVTSTIGAPVISNNIITENALGGIWCSNSFPTICNNKITGNGSTDGDGGICVTACGATISNNRISDNYTKYGGGGVECYGGTSGMYPRLCAIRNNFLVGNRAGSGGGISAERANCEIVNNTIVGNMAGSGGGVSTSICYSLTLANNIIAFNSSGHQGNRI